MDPITAGLISGVVLAVGFTVYMFLRGEALVAVSMQDENTPNVSPKMFFYVFLGVFILASLGLGSLSGVLYQMLGSRLLYTGIALGAAVLFSLVALITKTPLPWDKVAMNLMVGGILGILTPLLAG